MELLDPFVGCNFKNMGTYITYGVHDRLWCTLSEYWVLLLLVDTWGNSSHACTKILPLDGAYQQNAWWNSWQGSPVLGAIVHQNFPPWLDLPPKRITFPSIWSAVSWRCRSLYQWLWGYRNGLVWGVACGPFLRELIWGPFLLYSNLQLRNKAPNSISAADATTILRIPQNTKIAPFRAIGLSFCGTDPRKYCPTILLLAPISYR